MADHKIKIQEEEMSQIMAALSSLVEKKREEDTPVLLSTMHVSKEHPNQAIRFFRGDLTKAEQDYDIIVCSAYKNMYSPAWNSMIGSLFMYHNISVKKLAEDPELDMRSFGGWLSRPVNDHFRRILCIEMKTNETNSVQSDQSKETAMLKSSFLTLRNLLERSVLQGIEMRRIALPILGAGFQNFNIEYIVPPLFIQCTNMLHTIPSLETIDFYEINPEKANLLVSLCRELTKEDASVATPIAFISYSSAQMDFAHKIWSSMQNDGVKTWIAPESIPTGSNYLCEIPKAISSARLVLLLLTEEAQRSRWVQKEVGSAIGAGKILLPMQLYQFPLTPELSFLLEGEQIHPLWKEESTQHISVILQEIRKKLG